jgi:hypothetical protein
LVVRLKLKSTLKGVFERNKSAVAGVLNGLAFDWILLFRAVAMIRARREEDVSVSYTGVVGCLIAGIIMAVAKPLVTWLTGFNPDNPPQGLEEVGAMMGKLITLVTYLGVVLAVIGLIWAGLNMLRKSP